MKNKFTSICLFITVPVTFSFTLKAQDIRSGHFESFDKTKIYYEVKGQGFPGLLVHGFIVNGESWKKAAGDHNHASSTKEFADAVLKFIKE